MQRNKNKHQASTPRRRKGVREAIAVFRSPHGLCLAGLLAALSLILGKFLQIPTPFSQLVRISFENLPVILSGVVLGPLAGAMTGAVADLVGCLLYGYAINPIIMVGAAVVGFISGLCAWSFAGSRLWLQLAISVVTAHALGSVLIKSLGLAAWYLASYEMGYWELVLWRALTYTLISVLETMLLYFLLRHRGVAKQLERMCR